MAEKKLNVAKQTELPAIEKPTEIVQAVENTEVVNKRFQEMYTGIEHAISFDQKPKINFKKKDWEDERQRDREPVIGRFHHHESKGGTLTFTFYKYKGDPVVVYTLVDGCEYTLPRAVVHHLNNNCGRQVHEYTQDADGRRVMRIGYIEKRVSFQPRDAYSNQDLLPKPTLYTASGR